MTPHSKRKRSKLLYCEAQTIFLDVASDTLARIRRQRQRAPDRLRPILTYIESYLFSPGLTATRIYHACDIRDRSISTPFRRAVGTSPHRYIESCRMEVAERLVRETEIKITWIAALLGFRSLKVFASAFGRMTNERPLKYRQKHRVEALEKSLPRRSDELVLVAKLRRALDGALEPEEAATLIQQLHVLYPTIDKKSVYQKV